MVRVGRRDGGAGGFGDGARRGGLCIRGVQGRRCLRRQGLCAGDAVGPVRLEGMHSPVAQRSQWHVVIGGFGDDKLGGHKHCSVGLLEFTGRGLIGTFGRVALEVIIVGTCGR